MGSLSLLSTQSRSPVHPLFLLVKKIISLKMDISFFLYIYIYKLIRFNRITIIAYEKKLHLKVHALCPHPVSAFCFWIQCHLWL